MVESRALFPRRRRGHDRISITHTSRPAILNLASDHLKSELPVLRYVVPASAGGASASPQALDSPTRRRLKAGLHACHNENCCLPS